MRLTALRSIAAGSALLSGVLLLAERRPQYGGVLRIDVRAPLGTIDPSQPAVDPSEAAVQERLAGQVYETLVRFDDRGEPQPLLATGWVHDSAHKRWVFTARPRVTFHNGAAWEPAGGAVYVDDRQPIEEILSQLAEPRNAIALRAPDGALHGTGPFRIARWEAKKFATLEANDEYWGGRPFLDRVEVNLGRALRDQALDFELGKAEVVELPVTDLRRVQQRGGKVQVSAPVEILCLVLDPSKPDLARLLEPLSLAVDRNAIFAVLLQKQGEISSALLPQWLSGYAFVFPTVRDLARARQAVGPAQTLSFAFDRQDPLLRSIAERITLNASEAGLTLRAVAAGPADVRLAILRVLSPDARESLDRIAGQLQVPPPASSPEGGLYDLERALRDSARVIPLFHLPEVWQLSPAVRNWSRQLGDVWLEQRINP